MGYLIIYCHPNTKSFNHAILDTLKKRLDSEGKSYQIRDIYSLKFSPLLSAGDFIAFSKKELPQDIKREQDLMREAKTMIFIYPIWWFSMPAVLKGYMDRVLSHGFAYAVNEKGPYGLLTEKRVIIINTTGGPKEHYERGGLREALKTTTDIGIFEFCGMKVLEHKYFYAVPYITKKSRQDMLIELETINLG